MQRHAMNQTANHSTYAVIVAAGRGLRAGGDGPKQYADLGGETVLARTVDQFANHPQIDGLIVVIHPDDTALYAAAVGPESGRLLPPATGGATRQLSVLAGLEALADHAPDRVLIHDAARPFVDAGLISRVIDALDSHPAVLPVVAVRDTVKMLDAEGFVGDTLQRDSIRLAQTPQGFAFPDILHAHRVAYADGRDDFTDDCALAEAHGLAVVTVAGADANQKLTTEQDMAVARTHHSPPDIRTGTGYDVHQLIAGSAIWLCGVEIEHDKTLSGHSDADVGLHALTDALLGCIAAGDIGLHFPPSDPQWKGARSDQFLRHARQLVSDAGGTITHCDVTLICEAPKIGPHRNTMRQAIADILSIDVARISVKATTNERIGFIGREEGIAAIASATVVMG